MGVEDARARALERLRQRGDTGPTAADAGRNRALDRLAATRDAERADGPGSGILHEVANLKDMALALPGGLFGLGKDAAETAYNVARTPLTLGIGQLQQARGQSMAETGREIEEDFGGVGKLFVNPEMLKGEIKADPQATEGIGQYIPGSGKASAIANELFPFFGATGTSVSNTVERGTDLVAAGNPIQGFMRATRGENPYGGLGDTMYAKAWDEGEFLPAAIEDIANLSLLAEGGSVAAGRLAGTGGVEGTGLAGRAARAADDVARAEESVIAVGPGGASTSTIIPPVGATPAQVAAADRAAARLATAQSIEQGLAKTARMTARAGDLPATMWKLPGVIGETGGGRFGLFAAEAGGGRFPFGPAGSRTGLVGYMGDRGLGSLVTNLDRTAAGTALVDWWDQHPVEAARKMRLKVETNKWLRNLENKVTDARGGVARGGLLANRATKLAARALGASPDVVDLVPSMLLGEDAAALAELFDDPQHVQRVTDTLAAEGYIDNADPNLARDYLIEAAVGPENVTAFKIADQYRRGTMDPKAAAYLEQANAEMRNRMRAAREGRMLRDEGEKTPPTDAGRRRGQEQLGDVPMESVVERQIVPAQQRAEQQQARVADAYDDLTKAEGRLLIPDDVYRSPIRDQVGDVVAGVSPKVLRPAERVAAREGAADYAQSRSDRLFARPARDTATPAEFAAGVREQVRAGDRVSRARRGERAAQGAAEDVLGDVSSRAVPKSEGLFQGAVNREPSAGPPAVRAARDVEAVMGPAPKTKKARVEAADAAIGEVRGRLRERLDAEAGDLSREAQQKFGYDALPELPFIPPMRPDGRAPMQGIPEFWGDLTPEGRREFAHRYMERETTDARRVRAEQDYIYERRHPGEHLYEDWNIPAKEGGLAGLRQATPRAARPALIGDQADFGLQQYRRTEEYLNIEARHRQGYGLEASEGGIDATGAAGDIGGWADDWARIADDQTLVAEKRRALDGTARGRNRENVNIELDQLDPDEFVTIDEIGPGYEATTLTRAEVEAALKGFDDETGRPLTEAQRRTMMADALDAKRADLTAAHERMYTERLDRAMSTSYRPWEWDRDTYVDFVRDLENDIDNAPDGTPLDDLWAELDQLVPDAFAGDLDAVYQQFLAEADMRGLDRYRSATPDQIADRAVADVLEKVTRAFEADQGSGVQIPFAPARGVGWDSLTSKEKRVYKRFEAAAAVTDAGQVAADQRAAVRRLRGQMVAGIEDAAFATEAGRLARDADRLRPDTAKVYAAQMRAIENVAKAITKDQRRIGERQGVFKDRQAKLNRELVRQDRLNRKVQQARVEARLSEEATPARYAEMTRARSKVADELRRIGDESGDPYLGLLADDIGQIDVYKVASLGDPEHLISGGKPGTGLGSTGTSTLPFTRETGRRKLKGRTEGQTDYSTRGQTVLEAKRVTDQTINTGTRAMLEHFGRTASDVASETAGRRRGPVDILDDAGNPLTGKALHRVMSDDGWVAWDPDNITGTVAPGNVTPDTPFIPQAVWDASQKMLNESSDFMKAIEKWYDRRFMGTVKMWWLALSPRWLTTNIIGNVIMGSAGGGVPPHRLIKQMANARALLAEEAPVDWETGNRVQRRLFAQRQKLVAKGDRLRAEGATTPHRALNRGFTAEEVPYLRPGADGGNPPKSPIRKAATLSYRLNEYTDNVSRTAIYLDKMEPRRKVQEAWERGELSTEEFKAGLKNTRGPEAALKQALRAAGDFSKLSPFEKQAVKRVWVFYPWYRHITKLAMSLPIYAPARTAWLLHVADVFGGDPNEAREAGAGTRHQRNLPKFAQGGIPLGGNTEISASGINPFASGIDSPFFSVEGAVGATTPALQWPAAVLLGKDMKHGFRDFTRPPGDRDLDEYGRETNTPLAGRPDELLNYFGQQFPQGRLFQTATRPPILRYDSGDPMLVGGKPIESGRPSGASGAALGLFGVPTPQDINAEDVANRRQKRVTEAAKKRKRYQEQRERLGI